METRRRTTRPGRRAIASGSSTRGHGAARMPSFEDDKLADAARALAMGRRCSPDGVAALQAAAGNRAVQRFVNGPGITDEAAEGVGAMFARADRSTRPADGPGISDETAEGVGAMFVRAGRAARPRAEDPLSPTQAAAAGAYEGSKGARQASWESEVDFQHAAHDSRQKAAADAAKTGRLAPGQGLPADQQLLRAQAFAAKCAAEVQRLNGAAADADQARGDAAAVLARVAIIPKPFLTYKPNTAARLGTTTGRVQSHATTLAAKSAELRTRAVALGATPNNATFTDARRSSIDALWWAAVTADVASMDNDADRFAVNSVRTAMKAVITTDFTKPAKLAPTWADAEKVKVTSRAANSVPDLDDFRDELDDRVTAQHNPNKAEWLAWLGQLGWGKWKPGLWGSRSVGAVNGCNVHATCFLDRMTPPSVDVSEATMYQQLLGSGSLGFHVTVEAFGEISPDNPHYYRGPDKAPPGANPKRKGYWPQRWAIDKVTLKGIRDAAVTLAENRIKALKDVHGER